MPTTPCSVQLGNNIPSLSTQASCHLHGLSLSGSPPPPEGCFPNTINQPRLHTPSISPVLSLWTTNVPPLVTSGARWLGLRKWRQLGNPKHVYPVSALPSHMHCLALTTSHNPGSPGSIRNYLDLVGPRVYLQGIILTGNCYRKTQPMVGSPCLLLGPELC